MPATAASPLSIVLPNKLVTAEDLLSHPEWGPCELIRGKVVSVCRPSHPHSVLMTRCAQRLANFVEPSDLGDVGSGDGGLIIERGPDTVRGPDVHFISAARRSQLDKKTEFLTAAPELCIEILSPSDTRSKVQEKVGQFLKMGVKLVWVINPKTRSAHVYRADGSESEITGDGSLSGEKVLPGFKLSLKDLFAALH